MYVYNDVRVGRNERRLMMTNVYCVQCTRMCILYTTRGNDYRKETARNKSKPSVAIETKTSMRLSTFRLLLHGKNVPTAPRAPCADVLKPLKNVIRPARWFGLVRNVLLRDFDSLTAVRS